MFRYIGEIVLEIIGLATLILILIPILILIAEISGTVFVGLTAFIVMASVPIMFILSKIAITSIIKTIKHAILRR